MTEEKEISYLQQETKRTGWNPEGEQNPPDLPSSPSQKTECDGELTERRAQYSRKITAADLNSVLIARRKVAKARQKLMEAREAAGIGAVRYDKAGSSGNSASDSRLERKVIDIVDWENSLKMAEIQQSVAIMRLWVLFHALPDARARVIFWYRYCGLLGWGAIAQKLSGDNTAASVRKYHDRYIEKSIYFDI